MKKLMLVAFVLLLTLVFSTGAFAADTMATDGTATDGTYRGAGYTDHIRGYGNTADGVNTLGTRTYDNTYRTRAAATSNWGWLGLLGLIGLAGLWNRDKREADR